jgi:hypothetical protein
MGRIENLRVVDELLSDIAQGYSNEEYIHEQIFPVVETNKMQGKTPHFTKDNFLYLESKRAPGGDSNTVTTDIVQAPIAYNLEEFDQQEPIDYLEDEEAAFDLEAAATYNLSERMLLRREKKTADTVQDQTLYTNSNTSAVSVKWDVYATSNPIADINAAREVVRGNIGRYPNTLTFGATTWTVIKEHPQFTSRLATTDLAVVTPELVAELLDFEKVLIGKAVWLHPQTKVQADVWLDNCILSYVPKNVREQRNIRTPGFGYTLRKKGWAPMDKYQMPGNKVTMVRYTDITQALFHGNLAGYLLRDTNS